MPVSRAVSSTRRPSPNICEGARYEGSPQRPRALFADLLRQRQRLQAAHPAGEVEHRVQALVCYSLSHVAGWRVAPGRGIQRRLGPVLTQWSVLPGSSLGSSAALARPGEDTANLPTKPQEYAEHAYHHSLHPQVRNQDVEPTGHSEVYTVREICYRPHLGRRNRWAGRLGRIPPLASRGQQQPTGTSPLRGRTRAPRPLAYRRPSTSIDRRPG